MRLYEKQMVNCVLCEPPEDSDGEGGQIAKLTEGASFRAAITKEYTNNVQKADRLSVKESFNVTADRVLRLGDMFKADYDPYFEKEYRYFRVVSEPKKTPEQATFEYYRYSAEVDDEWQ